MRVRSHHLLLTFLLLLGALAPLAHAAQTLLVLSDGAEAYERTAERIRARLSRAMPDLVVDSVAIEAASSQRIAEADLVVAIGTQATTDVIDRYQPDRLICALLTHQTYQRLPPVRPGAERTAVFIDQPARRQIALIRAALPDMGRLAMIYGDGSKTYADALAQAGRDSGLTVNRARVGDETTLYNALLDVLQNDSVLLAVPDSAVYNNFTIQNILLTAYRQRTPVIGFSPAYVRAGAVAAVYSTPEQVGDQVAGVVLSALNGTALPRPAYPRHFSVSTNPHVARSLSLELPAEDALEASIARREARTP